MNSKPDILMAIHPEHGFNIFERRKTKDLRKMFPKLEPPFRVHVYCTKGIRETLNTWRGELFYDTQFPNERPNKLDGKVIGSFICDGYEKLYTCPDCNKQVQPESLINELCITEEQILEYLGWEDGYAWNITEPKLYDKPKELGEFRRYEFYKTRDAYGETFVCDGCQSAYWKDGVCSCSELLCEKVKVTRPPQSYMYVEPLEIE